MLGVERDASEAEIDAAWRRALHAAHPDRNPDDPDACERLKAVLEAGEVLRDPERRARWDARHPNPAANRPDGSAGDGRPGHEGSPPGAKPRPTWTSLAWDGGAKPTRRAYRLFAGQILIVHEDDR